MVPAVGFEPTSLVLEATAKPLSYASKYNPISTVASSITLNQHTEQEGPLPKAQHIPSGNGLFRNAIIFFI